MLIPITASLREDAQRMAERRAQYVKRHRLKAVFDPDGENEIDGMIKKQYLGCLGENGWATASGGQCLDRLGADPGWDVFDPLGLHYQVQTSGRFTNNNRELKVPVNKRVNADFLVQVRELDDDYLEIVGVISYRKWEAFRSYWIPIGDKGPFPCDVQQGDYHIRCRTYIVEPAYLISADEFFEWRTRFAEQQRQEAMA